MELNIRQETEQDYLAITEVNDLAFAQKNEGILVEQLRKNPEFVAELSLVAEQESQIVGHILFFPITIIEENIERQTLTLAPMAVRPEHQNKRIGGELVRKGLETARKLGYKSVVVVGHPNYYPRFGFKPASNWQIKCAFEVSDDVFMALELAENGLKDVAGVIKYPDEFNEAL